MIAARSPESGAPRAQRPVTIALVLIVALAAVLRVSAALDPSKVPLPDSKRYERLAADLYERGTFGDPGIGDANDYSPGTSLVVAGVYHATGGVHPAAGRVVLALFSTATVLIVFLIGRRLVGPEPRWPPLVGALLVAIYPVFRSYAGMTMSEPLAVFTLSATVLAALWADRRGKPRAWLLPGALLGATVLARPDYLPLGIALAALAAARTIPRAGPRAAAAAAGLATLAFVLPLAPWTIRNLGVHHRFVPVSTGGGKALFIGTFLPAYDGPLDPPRLNERLRAELFARYPGTRRQFRRRYPDLPVRGSTAQVMTVVAQRLHPGEPVDRAFTTMALDNFGDYAAPRPLHAISVAARKVWYSWSNGEYGYYHPTMRRRGWAALHVAICALGLFGLAVLAVRRRWEALMLGALLAWGALLTALFIPSPRRVLVLVPMLAALCSVGVAALDRLAREQAGRRAPFSRPRSWRPRTFRRSA